jgi:hypothetical protein
MNLQEFINYRKHCPICESQLITQFHSSRKQNIKYENNKLSVFFSLPPLSRKQKTYKVAYSFSLQEFSLAIEFYSKDGATWYHNKAEGFLRKRFLDLHLNLEKTRFRFLRECTSCTQYSYYSNFFNINLRSASFENLFLHSESVGLTTALAEEGLNRIFRLVNIISEKKTYLFFWKGPVGDACVWLPIGIKGVTKIESPLIPFVSKEETTNRLQKLIIFT